MKIITLALYLTALALLAGCAPQSRTLVVLLPDAEGEVGAIHVQTDQGSVMLQQSFVAVTTITRKEPSPPEPMQPPQIEFRFEKALAMEPPQQFRFKKWILHCRNNSTELTPESQTRFLEVIRHLIAEPPIELYAVGHTDTVGTESYNQQLSRHRALEIEQALMARGIDPMIIRVNFLGQSSPMVITADRVPEPRNRRVELVGKYSKEE